MKLKQLILPMAIGVVLTGLTGCKPTEANYQSAYDAALGKRNQTDPDAELLFGSHKLSSPLGAQPQTIEGQEILVLHSPALISEAGPEADGNRYRVAIALYRMEANAKAHAAKLINDGLKGACVAKLADEQFIVVSHSYSSASLAAKGITALRTAKPEGPWIGLTPPEPFLLIAP